MITTPTPLEAITIAIEIAGSQVDLARRCDCSQTAVWKWLQSAKRVGDGYALLVEYATGMSRHFLRPDLYPLEGRPTPALPDHPAVSNWLSQVNATHPCETKAKLQPARPAHVRTSRNIERSAAA